MPSADDTASAREEITELAEQFRSTTNDSLFYMSNASTKVPLASQKVSQLSPELSTNPYNAETDTVYDPDFEGGTFQVAKLLNAAIIPDSIRASTIMTIAETTTKPH